MVPYNDNWLPRPSAETRVPIARNDAGRNTPHSPTLGGLRQRAEELLRKTRTKVATMSTEDIKTLVHELQVYQMELESQNEALHEAQVGSQESLARFVDLYDSAPVGYLTLDRNGHIEKANLTAATLLKVERAELIGQPLARFFKAEYSDTLQLYVREAFTTGTKQSCELPCTASDGSSFYAQLDSIVTLDGDSPRCHTTLADRTGIKRAEEKLVGFGRLLDDSLNEIYIFDADSLRFLRVNRGARENLGYSMDELRELTPLELKPEFTADTFAELIRPLRTGERSLIEFETIHRRKDCSRYPVEVHLQLSNFQGSLAYVAIILDNTRRQRAERELGGHKQALELLASGASLKMVMQALVEVAESASPGMLGSILILDRKTMCFSETYAPSLPEFYNNAIVGLSIGDGVGSCGTAAYTGQRVVVEDVMTHPYWADYRDLADRAGLRACWSEPITSSRREILGTFAMYYREPCRPSDDDLNLIRSTSRLAALAIEQRQNEEAIKDAHDRLETRVQERTAEFVAANRLLNVALEDLESEERLLRRLIDLQEQERRMVAHDIHDGFVQDVVGAHMRVQCIHSEADPDANEATAQEVAALLKKAINEGRRLISGMRPMVLDEKGIVESIRHLIADEESLSDLVISFDHDVRFDRLEPKLEGVIFRIVQEALNNVKRHSQTNDAAVKLTQKDGNLIVMIRDRGVGFDPKHLSRECFGLRGIRERARLFGGTSRIESAPGEGTTVYAQLPIDLGD